jgi:anti-anti-sigma regulatory factor
LLASGARVRIDLSRLEFIDSRGMHALIRVVALGRDLGDERIEIDRELRNNVRELLELTGIARMLWSQTCATPRQDSNRAREQQMQAEVATVRYVGTTV